MLGGDCGVASVVADRIDAARRVQAGVSSVVAVTRYKTRPKGTITLQSSGFAIIVKI